MSIYSKPHLSFEEQLRLLKDRGLQVTCDEQALQYLERLGYYRLSGYWYPLRQLRPAGSPQKSTSNRQDQFVVGAKFEDAVRLYVFDKKLRLLVLDAIERIEVAIRVDIAYRLGKKDTFAYTKPDLLHPHFTEKIRGETGQTAYALWSAKHEQLIHRSREDFAKYHKSKYGLPLPIWVAIELWDFGLLSTFYQGMRISDKAAIAALYGLADWRIMESWLRTINYARNIAAHHSRLWNKNLVDQPKLPPKGRLSAFDPLIKDKRVRSRVYILLCVLAYLIHAICPNSSWSARLKALVHDFPKTLQIDIDSMGFPPDWMQHTFWNKS